MQNWISWVPLPRSWVNAIALILLMATFQHFSGYLWWLISWLITISPKFIYLFYLLATFSPILLIAFAHHWLHQLLDQFFPESRLPNTDPVQGTFPGLMSWWEGFYGWLVNYFSQILSWSILGLLLPISTPTSFLKFNSWSLQYSLNQPHPFFITFLIAQIVFAAYFYQFEHAVQRHLTNTERRS
jgi:hypothetical protein